MNTRVVAVRRRGASAQPGAGARRSRVGALILVVAGVAAACGTAGQTPPVAPIVLDSSTWRVRDVNGNTPYPGWEPTAQFRSGVAQGWSGCGTYQIPYKQSPGSIDVTGLDATSSCYIWGFGTYLEFIAQQFGAAMNGAKWVNVDSTGNLVFEGDGGKITWVPDQAGPIIP